MVHKANERIEKNEFDFIITGEVIGQRPKSQRKDTMPIISKESGANELLLRPLCAKNLPPSKPELEGWVDREKLYGFEGRTRKPQMALATELGFDDYAQPAGGCYFLTDKQYSQKLADLWKASSSRRYELDDIMLLKVGRHLRPRPHFKLIIGREDGENRFLHGYRKQYTHLFTVSHKGPLVLIDGDTAAEDLDLAAQITARFSQGRNADRVEVGIQLLDGSSQTLSVRPIAAEAMPADWYL
jgi:hypothetical protein